MSDVSNIDPTEPADGVAASKQDLRNNAQGTHDYLAQLQDLAGGPYAGATTLNDEDHSLDGGATAATATRRLIIVNDTLTADRTLSLPTSGVDFNGVFGHGLDNPAVPGAYYFIAYDLIRPAGSPAGSSDFIVAGLDGGALVLASGEWMRIAYAAGAWRVIAHGSLGTGGPAVTFSENDYHLWGAPQIVAEYTQAQDNPYSWDTLLAQSMARTLDAATTTISLFNLVRGGIYNLVVRQDGIGGRDLGFGYAGAVRWMTPEPDWSSQANGAVTRVVIEAHAFADEDPLEVWFYATEQG